MASLAACAGDAVLRVPDLPRTAVAAGASVTEQSDGIPTPATRAPRGGRQGIPARPSGTAVPNQHAPAAAGAAGAGGLQPDGRTSGTACAAIADQSGGATASSRPARTECRRRFSRSAVAAAAPQEAARPAVLTGSRRAVGAVADQWALQQHLGRCIDQVQYLLLQGLPRVGDGRGVGGLGAGVQIRAGIEGLDELLVKRCGLRAESLVAPALQLEQRRHCRGHLVGAGRQQSRGRYQRRRGGFVDCRTDAGQVPRCGRHNVGRCDDVRHVLFPPFPMQSGGKRIAVPGNTGLNPVRDRRNSPQAHI